MQQRELTDDALTLAALGILSFISADLSHEALGHGLATLVVGGKPVLLTSSYFASSGSTSRWIPAAGSIANVVAGSLSWLILRSTKPTSPHLRYFLILCIAFNLLFAAGYPAYSGIALFGDWAGVISGLSPAWMWRMLLVAIGISGYFLSLQLLSIESRPFSGWDGQESPGRLRRITLIPFLAAIGAAFLAGTLNPRGWSNIFMAAVPAAAGSFGLTQLDHFVTRSNDLSVSFAGSISRHRIYLIVAAVVLAIFVGVFGPGIHFHSQ